MTTKALARPSSSCTPSRSTPACGSRTREQSPPTSIDAHADDLAALLDERAIPRATLVGLSMGGYIAIAFARRHGARLAGLVLADTRAAADSDEAKAGRDASIAKVRAEGVPALVEGMLSKLLGPSVSAEVRERIRALACEQAPAGVISALTAMRDRADATGVLPTITVPALVMVGRADTLTKPDEAEAMARALPHASLTMLEGAGHLSNQESAEAFTAELRGFLDRHRL